MSGRALSRRRFLSIVAASGASSFGASPGFGREWTRETWAGIALGAEARITLTGPPDTVHAALEAAVAELRRAERLYSLFDAESALSRLNRDGILPTPPPEMVALLHLCGDVHMLTGGLFDPTVQPLWAALAYGADGAELQRARDAVGWGRVRVTPELIALEAGQALTLNGIAQGAAADAVTAALRAHGIDRALVDTGELSALGGPWRLGVHDPAHGTVSGLRISGGAVATSSPSALSLGREWHILSPLPDLRPVWSTVSVEADRAAMADALSTAGVMMSAKALADLMAKTPALRRILVVDAQGDLTTL